MKFNLTLLAFHLQSECEGLVLEYIHLLLFTMQSQILKQHVLRGQQVVILQMVDKLSDSKTVHRAKLNSASPWLPFKVKKFVKRICFFPPVFSQLHTSLHYTAIVALSNKIFKLCLSFVFYWISFGLLLGL